MTPEGLEPEFPASERTQPHALDCAATRTGLVLGTIVNVPLMVMLFV